MPAAWGGGGYALAPNLDGTVAITMTMMPFEAPNQRDARIWSLQVLGWQPVTVDEDNPHSAHRGEARHVTVTPPRGVDAERHQLATEVHAILDAHRRRTDPTETFQVRTATDRDFPGANAGTAVIATGRMALDSDLKRAGYTTERLGARGVVVRRPQGAVPIGPNSPAHNTRPATVRLTAVKAALRPLHAQLTTLLSAVQDRHPDLDDLTGLDAELTALDEEFPLASNPPGVLEQSARSRTLQRTPAYRLLDLLKREGARRNENLERALVEAHGQGADRFVRGLAATLQRLLDEYASGRDDVARTWLASPRPTWEEEQRSRDNEPTPTPATAQTNAPAAPAPAMQPQTALAAQAQSGASPVGEAPPGPAAGRHSGHGQRAAEPLSGGGAGPGTPPPPAPGGNDEADRPAKQLQAKAFTHFKEISAPRRALNQAVRTLVATAHFERRAAQNGPETELREALAAFTRVSLNDPADFHTAVEVIHAAVTAVHGAWRNTDVPEETARALDELVQAADFFAASWRATVASTAWDRLFKGAPRPSLPSTGRAAEPAALELNDAAVPGISLAEQHAAIRTVIDTFGALGAGVSSPTERGSGLAAFVRRMDDPDQWRAWREGMVTSGRGLWLGGPHLSEDLQGLGRLDPARDGILITTQGGRNRPTMRLVMRWEELPAWIHLGLSAQTRRELLDADEAYVSALAASTGGGADRSRLSSAEQTVWAALRAAGTPTARALAAAWNRYRADAAAAEADALFELESTVPAEGPYASLDEFTRATEEVITAAWALTAHPQWPAGDTRTAQLRQASAAVRASSPTAITASDAVRAVLMLAQATHDPALRDALPAELRPVLDALADRARQHADQAAATAWNEQAWRQVFPSAMELWHEDPFLLPRLGYPDPRQRPISETPMEPLGDYEAFGNQDYEQIARSDLLDRLCYRVPGTDGFTVRQESVWSGPAYTLRTPDDAIVATLVKEGSGWHTVMGQHLPGHTNEPVTVLPAQPYGPDNFHHAVLNALRVWAQETGHPLPGHPTYPDTMRVSWAFADLEPVPDALHAAARRTWPLTYTRQPVLARVLEALEQVQAHERINLDDEQIRTKADALERLAPTVAALRAQLESEHLHASDLYGLVRVLAGYAHEMPGRLRTFADGSTTPAPQPAPAVTPTPETAAPAPEASMTTPASGNDIPVAEGGVWEPDYPVPPTADELWRIAQASGWSMTRETIPGSYGTDRFKVFLEAHTTVGHWKFSLEWRLRKGRYAADKERSWAWWPDGRTGPRGGEVHPTVADAREAMRRYKAVPAPAEEHPEPVEQAAAQATGQAVTSSAGLISTSASDATPAPAADSRYSTREIEGMPGYWWREEPPRATDRYTTERVTVGFGDETIGEAYGPGWQGRTGWTIPDATDLVHGGQTSAEAAQLLATRHQAQKQAAPVAGTSAAVSAAQAGESPGIPFDAQEVAGMPGYWWRLEPPREGARDDVEHITVGYGTERIGHGHGPNGWDGATKWKIVVGTAYMPGERTPSASARKIAERHQALQEAARLTGPRPAETVWIYHEPEHGEETRTYVFGVAESDKDALAALEAEDFIRMPSAGAWVQRKGTRPETRAYKTGLFVRRMLKHGRSIAVHYHRDGFPADSTLPELDDARVGELAGLTQMERRDWSPIEFQAGDQVLLKGPHSWWHTVTDVQPGQLTLELETVVYGDVLARRRGEDLLTIADPVGELSTARPGTLNLRGEAPEALDAEQARLELPLADPAHAPFVDARRAQITTERERVSGDLARKEKNRAQLQAILRNPKELKNLSGRLVHNEAGDLLGAVVSRDKMPNPPRTRKQSRKWIFVDVDGNAVGALDRKSDAEQYAIDREDDLHAVVPEGWRSGAWAQIGPGEVVRLPAEQGRRLTPEAWTSAFTVSSLSRNADGSVSVEGTRQGAPVSYHLSAAVAQTGPLREAVGELALLPETIVARAARPALLAALDHPTNGVLFPVIGHDELMRSMRAVSAAAKAIEARPTSVVKLREQVLTARDALAHLAEVASADGVDVMPERARAGVEVMEHWAAQLEDVESAAARLTATAAPTGNGQSPADAAAASPQAAVQAPVGQPWTQMRREEFDGAPAPVTQDSVSVPEGQWDLDSSDANFPSDDNASAEEAAEAQQGESGAVAEDGMRPAETATRSTLAQGRPEDSPVSIYDAMLLGGQEAARALLARVTVGEFAADGEFLRAQVLLDGEAIGSVVTRPDGGYAATTIENWTSRHSYETVAGAVAQVVQSYDSWVADGEERQARARELGLDPTAAATDGELPEGATPVAGFPGYYQVSAYPGTVVYGPGNRKIGSVENRTYNRGKHKTLYGDDSPIKGQNTIERSVQHLVDVHAELNDVPNRQTGRNVWIEHHPDHTNVWGATGRELLFALEVAGGPRGFNERIVDGAHRQHGMYQHALPKSLTYETRTEKINMLRALLSARGREIPVFESLEAKQEAEAVDRAQTAVPAPVAPARAAVPGTAEAAAPAPQDEHTAPVGRSSGQQPQVQAAPAMAIHAMDVDDLDETIEALKDATDPLSLAYRLRAERRRWALLRQEAEDWVPQPQYDAQGDLVEPSRGQILRERADGYRLNPNEAQGAVTSVDDLPPAKPGGYTDARWAEIIVAAAAAEEFPPTAEQDIIIEAAARRGLDLRVMALAGTGKSTTLKMLSRRMPGKRILYLAFNRSVADEAIEAQQRGEYSDNLTPTTANAYANSMVDEALLTRLNWPKLNEQQLADRMRWRSRIPAGGESLSPPRAPDRAQPRRGVLV
ncbi:hypothetical protein ACFW9F_03660 [Streptomyces sp. NPDC059506]|uniref:hypothetical protein n=1 Tax=Streptomyces sp. NPDC059506 TaxID=3347751 RepID=UPI00367A1245